MKILLLSFSPDFGGTLEADILTAQLKRQRYPTMHVGMSDEILDAALVEAFQPDVIGLFHSFRYPKWNMYIIKRIREIFEGQDIPICMCVDLQYGYQRKILQEYPEISYVISGESEGAWLQFLERLDHDQSMESCPNLTSRDSVNKDEEAGIPIYDFPKNLDTLAWADKEDIIRKKQKHSLLYASRGCIHSCNFCMTQNIKNPRRERDILDVVQEMENNYKKYGIIGYHFTDSVLFDSSPHSMNRLATFVTELQSRKLSLLYTANFCPAFVLQVSPDVLDKLLQTGLYSVLIGIESGNRQDLELYNKHSAVNTNHRALRAWKKIGVDIKVGFININPYSTLSTLSENTEFLQENTLCFLHHVKKRYWMIQHTPLYYRLQKDALLTDPHDLYGYLFAHPLIMSYCSYLEKIKDKPLEKRINNITEMLGYSRRLVYLIQDTQIERLVDDMSEQVHSLLHRISSDTYEFTMRSIQEAKMERLNKQTALDLLVQAQSRMNHYIFLIDKIKKLFLYALEKCPSPYRNTFHEYLRN